MKRALALAIIGLVLACADDGAPRKSLLSQADDAMGAPVKRWTNDRPDAGVRDGGTRR